MATNPIPTGFEGVTPYLIIKNATGAIDFYKTVFGAEEVMRMSTPHGAIGHAEIKIGNGHVMLTDENIEAGWKGPQTVGGNPVSLVVYVADCDATFSTAITNGATETKPMEDQFYGDRMGTITDPFGHIWSIGTHVEDVSPEEMQARMAKMMEGNA